MLASGPRGTDWTGKGWQERSIVFFWEGLPEAGEEVTGAFGWGSVPHS